MSAELVKTNAKSVLSLGIGHNVVSDKLISMLGNQLDTYTIVEGAIEIIDQFNAKHNNDSIKVYHSYFENFEPDQEYDAIEMGFVLEHVDDPSLIISRFKGMMKKGGKMYISVPNARSLHRVIGNKAGLLDDVYKLSPYDLELGHKRYFDLDSIRRTVTEAGMKIVTEKGLMMKPITGEQMRQLNWGMNIIEALLEVGENYPEIANCMYLEAVVA